MQWLLMIVTAVAPGEFQNEVLSQHDTISQCHVAATQIHWEEMMAINNEMLCIQVSGDRV